MKNDNSQILLKLAWLVSATNIIAFVLALWSGVIAYLNSGLIALGITSAYIALVFASSSAKNPVLEFIAKKSFFSMIPLLLFWTYRVGFGLFFVITLLFVAAGIILWIIYWQMDETRHHRR